MKKVLLILFLPLFSFSQKKWTLQEVLDYAIKNNLQIIDKELFLKIEKTEFLLLKNEKLPSIFGNFNNQIRFGQTQGFQGSIGRNDNLSNNLTISANMLIFNGKKLNKQALKKYYDVQSAQYNINQIKEDISLQIIQQYLFVLLKKEIWAVK